MIDLPDPPKATGLTWRPWTIDDVAALARHGLRVHDAEHLDSVPGADLYRWMVGQASFDPTTDTLAAFDAAGEVHAEVSVWAPVTETGARAFLWVGAAPPRTDLRAFLIDWGEARGRQRLAADPTGERVIRIHAEEHRAGIRAQIEAAGFRRARSFVTMRRSLADLPATPTLPEGITVAGWTDADDESARLASNEAFADHWGSQPMPAEMWHGSYRDSPTFRPDLSFVARDGGRVVALCLVEVSEEDNQARGRSEAYVDRVATLRSHRRLGLASHLLVRSLAAAAGAGLEGATLDVDESSHTSATEVYRRLGFREEDRSIAYVKEL